MAATTPIIPSVIKTSANVKPHFTLVGGRFTCVAPSTNVKPQFTLVGSQSADVIPHFKFFILKILDIFKTPQFSIHNVFIHFSRHYVYDKTQLLYHNIYYE